MAVNAASKIGDAELMIGSGELATPPFNKMVSINAILLFSCPEYESLHLNALTQTCSPNGLLFVSLDDVRQLMKSNGVRHLD